MAKELYRYQYLVAADPERESSDIDSVVFTEFIMAENEVDALIQAEQCEGDGVYGVRKATEAEIIAYTAGYDDGSLVSLAQERLENDRGIYYRLDSVVGGKMQSTKLFTCGGCGERFHFEDAVMVGKNYLMRLHGENEIPWHVCIKCV